MSLDNAEEPMDPGDLGPKNRVFLCHSGFQKSFVEQLSLDLMSVGRYSFYDGRRDSLPVGKKFPTFISEAIERCEVGVVVLSEEFFMQSHWPMFEVVKMMECGRRVIPVYLGISPADLSNEEKVSKWKWMWETFLNVNLRIDVAKWESTLRFLRSYHGLVYNHAVGEVMFRKEIVKAVCQRVRSWDHSHVQGMSRICKVIKERISETPLSKNGVRVVGLYGEGGIGKTTACKCLCKDLALEFDGRVCHIGFRDGTSELARVQKVLKRLTSTNNEFLNDKNLDECWIRLRGQLPLKKVVLAIDTLSFSNNSWKEARKYLRLEYGNGSIVMVIARALGELENLGIKSDNCLPMPELVEAEARALFLCHAGRSENEVNEEVVLKCILQCCFIKGDGSGLRCYHPLALEILGRRFFRVHPLKWKSQLEEEDVLNQQSKDVHPIFSILGMSFDTLRPEYQMLFMDVALFNDGGHLRNFESDLKGENTIFEWLSMVHEISIDHVKFGLNVLKTRTLLEELGDGNGQIKMHDLWWEFAIMKATHAMENHYEWVYEDAYTGGEGSESCMACGGWIRLRRICIEERSIKSINFNNCSKVIVLRLENVYVENGTLDLSGLKSIKSLEIVHCHPIELKPNQNEHQIVSGIGQLLELKILTWLNIDNEAVNAAENISFLTNLRVLHLSCHSTGGSSTSLDLQQLRYLQDVRVKLPNMVSISGFSSEMKELRILDLGGCCELRWCVGVGDVDSLEVLILDRCRKLKQFPNLQKLTRLQRLHIATIVDLSILTALKSLLLSDRKFERLPYMSTEMRLESLQLSDCFMLRSLDGSWGSGRGLDFQVDSTFSNLRDLIVRNCVALELIDLSHFPQLRILLVEEQRECRNFRSAEFVLHCHANHVHLETLIVWGMAIKDLPDLSNFPSLQCVDIIGCSNLTSMTISKPLSALSRVVLDRCRELHTVLNIDLIPRLTAFKFQDCGVELNEHEVQKLEARGFRVNGNGEYLVLPSSADEEVPVDAPDDLDAALEPDTPSVFIPYDESEIGRHFIPKRALELGSSSGSNQEQTKKLKTTETLRETTNTSLLLEGDQTAFTTVLEDQRHEVDIPVDVDNIEFQVEKDVAGGVPLHLYKAMFSGGGYVESIITALDLCETQVREFKKLLLVVRVFRHQCTKLVETLESTAVNVFGRCRKVMDGLQKLEAGGSEFLSGNRSKTCVRFCFEPLVGLASNFQLVVDLLRKCGSEDLPKTALEVADLPSYSILMSRRWTKFSLAIRNCEWCMDLVEFAFYRLEALLAGGAHIPEDVSFNWCEEKCRLVLQSERRLGREGKKLEKSVLDLDYEVESQDLGDLIDQLRRLAEASESVGYANSADSALGSAGSKADSAVSAHSADSAEVGGLADPSDAIMQTLEVDATHGLRLSKVVFNRARMADFLSKKLSEPIQYAERLPWTFRVEPSSLKSGEVLESGGSGMLPEYTWLGESVAVKTVWSPGLTCQQFEEEAAVLAVVQHPNVVRLIGCGFIDERKTGMLVMELMDHDLRTVIESKLRELGPGSSPFATNVAIDIILQIAEAMRHLRVHGVLHRDLKTENILVNIYKPLNPSGMSDLACALPHLQEEYVVKINEVGLAKCRPRSSWPHTRLGGTCRWIAPEVSHVQELDETQDYAWPAVVYSFAMTCYEILTGKLPFANYPDDAIPERAILAGMRPEGLDEVEVPNLLKKLVKQCWATNPDERPSFEEIVKSMWECRLEAISPVLIGDELLIDLTKDFLDVSSTGYVIRTSCSGMQGRAQPCALKRIDVMDSNETDLARLNHPHVVQLIDYWIEKKYLFLIMELMDGDLAKLMAWTKEPMASPFTLHVTVDLMLQIALGMRYLHEMDVSHPHLKCENVLYRVVIKAEGYAVGDVLVKLGGFGWSRPADVHSKNRDVICFGQTCLEILTGNVNSGMVFKSSIPETIPVVLKNCIVSCLETQTTFANVVEELSRAKSDIFVHCGKDETICLSEVTQTQTVPTKTEESLDEIFTVHQLHPQSGDASTSIRATLVFFHGFHKFPEEWRRTWMTRDNKLVWPQKWLPEDLGSQNIRVFSVSFDANSNVSNKYNRHEIGKNLVEGLILSPRWKLGEKGEPVILIGHSFGGVLIKSFVTEAQNFLIERVQNNAQERAKCMKFLSNLAEVVFYSVPHAVLAPVEFEDYISQCMKVVPLQRSSFLQSLRDDTRFIADMCKLSVDFEGALPVNVKVLAFLEGKALMSMKRVLVTEKSFEGLSRPWEWHKVDKDNHFEVSRPESKNHIGYKILLDHLRQYINRTHSK